MLREELQAKEVLKEAEAKRKGQEHIFRLSCLTEQSI